MWKFSNVILPKKEGRDEGQGKEKKEGIEEKKI
jgi:hypothetical protein